MAEPENTKTSMSGPIVMGLAAIAGLGAAFSPIGILGGLAIGILTLFGGALASGLISGDGVLSNISAAIESLTKGTGKLFGVDVPSSDEIYKQATGQAAGQIGLVEGIGTLVGGGGTVLGVRSLVKHYRNRKPNEIFNSAVEVLKRVDINHPESISDDDLAKLIATQDNPKVEKKIQAAEKDGWFSSAKQPKMGKRIKDAIRARENHDTIQAEVARQVKAAGGDKAAAAHASPDQDATRPGQGDLGQSQHFVDKSITPPDTASKPSASNEAGHAAADPNTKSELEHSAPKPSEPQTQLEPAPKSADTTTLLAEPQKLTAQKRFADDQLGPAKPVDPLDVFKNAPGEGASSAVPGSRPNTAQLEFTGDQKPVVGSKANLGMALGQAASGVNGIMHGTATEKALGGLNVVDATMDTLQNVPKISPYAQNYILRFAGPIAGVNAIFDGKRGISELSQGHVGEGLKNVGYGVQNAAVSVAYVSRTQIAQRVVGARAAGIGGKLLGRVALPVAAAIAVYDTGQLAKEGYGLARDSAIVLNKDAALHGAGVNEQYSSKLNNLMTSLVAPEIKMQAPEFSDYKNLGIATNYIKEKFSLSDSTVQNLSTAQMEEFLDKASALASQEKQKALNKFSSFPGFRKIVGMLNPIAALNPTNVMSDRMMAETQAGRLAMEMDREMANTYAIGQDEIHKKFKADISEVAQADSMLRHIAAARQEFKGDSNGELGDPRILAFDKRKALFAESQKLRSEYQAAMNEGGMETLEETIDTERVFQAKALGNTAVSAALAKEMAQNPVLKDQQHYIEITKELAAKEADDVLKFKALVLEADLLQKQKEIIVKALSTTKLTSNFDVKEAHSVELQSTPLVQNIAQALTNPRFS